MSEQFVAIGDCAIRLSVDVRGIDLDALRRALAAQDSLLSLIPTQDALTLRYAAGSDLQSAAKRATAALANALSVTRPQRVHQVPLLADKGEDLTMIAEHAGMSADQFLDAFCALEFVVVQIGFQPGFPYLSGLPRAWALRRRAAPRPRVPAGSVAIGGGYAGIYPNATPGGWHLLARTQWVLFDPHRLEPCLFATGDRVRFVR